MQYVEFDETKLQSFEISKTAISDKNIIGTCELGTAELQLLNDSNEYSNFKDKWIKTIHGSFYIYNVEPVQERVNIKFSCYDIKYLLDVKYEQNKFEDIFPCSISTWRNKIAERYGIQFNDNDNFPFADLVLDKHPYVGEDVSVRDVMKQMSQACVSYIDTDANDFFYFSWFDFLNPITIEDWLDLTTEKEPTDKVNVAVLGRGNVEDNVAYPIPLPKNPKEFRIDNNYILDSQEVDGVDNRTELVKTVYDRVKDFKYIIYSMRTQSAANIFDIKLGSSIKYVDIWGNKLESVVMSIKLNWLGGNLEDSENYEITISAEEINETSTEFKYTSSIPKQILDVNRKCDKLNGIIEDTVKKVDNNKEEITKITQSSGEIKATIDSLDKEYKQNINTSNDLEGNPIVVENAGNYNLDNLEIDGSYYQNGIPSFDNPVAIKVTTPNNDGYLYLTTCDNNLFDGNLEDGRYNIDTGVKQYSNTQKRNVNPIPVIPGKDYIISNNGTGLAIFIYEYDEDMQFIKYSGFVASNSAYKVSNKTKYINFSREASVNMDFIQINVGTKILPYEEYKSSVAKIDLNIYDDKENKNGTYRLISGPNKRDTFINGTLTKRISVLTLNGSENWKIYRDVDTSVEMFAPVLKNGSKVGKNKIICDRLPAKYNDTSADEHIRNVGSANPEYLMITINKSRLDDTSNSTLVSSFKTLLSQNNIVVYYELEEDEVYQISYEKLKLFKGFNYLSLSSQIANMKIKYLTDSVLNGTFASHGELKVTADSISEKLSGEIKDIEGNIINTVNATLDKRIGEDGVSVSDVLTRHTNEVINPAISDAKKDAIKDANSATDTKLSGYLKKTDAKNTVEKVIKDNLNQETSILSTTITESAKEISANAVDAKFNNIAIEGCVVPYYSSNPKTYVTYNDYFNTGNIIVERLANIENEGPILEHGIKFIKDKFYTISFDLRVFIGDVSKFYVYNGCGYLNSVVLIDGFTKGSFNQSIDFPTDKARHKIELRFKAVDNADYNTINTKHLILQMNKATTDAYRIGIYNYKIEEGIGKTKWEPCFKSLSTTKEMTNVIDRKITDKENSIIASVSETYETKESVTNKLKDYSTTKQVEAKLELKVDNTEYNKIVSMLNEAADEITLDGGSKIHLKSAGSLLIDAGNFKLDANGTATLVNGIFSGKITSSSGKIGGWDIGSNYLKNEVGDYAVTIANGTDSVQTFLNIKDKVNNTYPFSLKVDGTFKAEKGNIGGWIISSDRLSKNAGRYAVGLLASGNVSTDAVFHVWDDTAKENTFYITNAGYLYAKNADISGTIHSNSGKIGGWNIESDELNSNIILKDGTKRWNYIKANGNVMFAGNYGIINFDNEIVKINTAKKMIISDVYNNSTLGSNHASIGIYADTSWLQLSGKDRIQLSNNLYIGDSPYQSSSKNMKKNIKLLTDKEKQDVYDAVKNIPLKKYDYKKKYGTKFHYGFIIEDLEDTILNRLLHIEQNKDDKNVKTYNADDLDRIMLVVIQELMKKVERLENKLCQ